MDYRQAANFWTERDAHGKRMDRETLLAEIDAFLAARRVCALATGFGEFVRCTPIEYSWRDGKLWMFSEGGLKFSALEHNRNVCAAIYEENPDFAALRGMQISGTAELTEPWSEEYRAQLAFRHIPEEAVRGLPHPMYLLCVTPARIDFLSAAFRERGFDARQHLEF